MMENGRFDRIWAKLDGIEDDLKGLSERMLRIEMSLEAHDKRASQAAFKRWQVFAVIVGPLVATVLGGIALQYLK